MVNYSNNFNNHQGEESIMGQIQWTISLVLIGLFSIAVIGFAMNFAIDNNAPINLASDPEISSLYLETKGNVSGFSGGAEDTYESIISSTIEPEGSTLGSAGPFAITPMNVIGVVKNILNVGYTKVFGGNSGFGLFLTAFLGMIVFITALLIWKTLAGRNPE